MNASFRKIFKPVALFIVLQLILIEPAVTQNRDRIVRGIVKDNQGQAIEGASVQIYRIDGGNTKNKTTDKKGQFAFILGNQAGTYHVGVRKEGFKPEYKLNVRPEVDADPQYIEFKLTPGKDAEWFWSMSLDDLIHQPDITAEIIEARQSLQALYEKSFRALYGKGMQAYKDGKYDEAINHLIQATEKTPKKPLPWFYLGLTYAKKEQYTEAIEACRRAIAVDPKFSEAHYCLGLALANSEKTICEAAREFNAYLKIGDNAEFKKTATLMAEKFKDAKCND
jgi:tetratricopeptide (TPR) repeat protein